MDSWSNDQVDAMKRNGNAKSNRTYNPQNARPAIPLDVDEVDSAMERFIRQKYDQQVFSNGTTRPPARQNTGSTGSSEDQPPPLPPKTGRRFGFGLRAASSTIPLSKRDRELQSGYHEGTKALSPPPQAILVNKQSRVFGASVGATGGSVDQKLATLRDMGFMDDKRNMTILKGFGGNLERSIESLVRLGEGSSPGLRAQKSIPGLRTQSPFQSTVVDQPPSDRPQTAGFVNDTNAAASGSTAPLQSSQMRGQTAIQSAPLPQQQFGVGYNNSNPFHQQQQPQQTYNPFQNLNPYGQTQQVESAFQGMQISQPLFPNNTGGHPTQQQQQIQQARLQQSMTPPVPQIPQQYLFSNPYAQQNTSHNAGYNPFMQTMQQVQTVASNPYLSSTPSFRPSNPYIDQTLTEGHRSLPPPPELQQTQPTQQAQQSHPPQQTYFAQQQAPLQQQYPLQQQSPSQQQYPSANMSNLSFSQPQSQYQPQPMAPQRTGRFDKSSILALYNYPQLAPAQNLNKPAEMNETPAALPIPKIRPGVPPTRGQRSVTAPAQTLGSSRNPFLSAGSGQEPGTGAPQASGGGSRHVSQESVDIGGLQSGRHSPDAFASLSARFVR
ncbi:Ubiquitin-associated/translation elongation factor EF1B, N-terminal, eukaryote [Lasallia pustulata]|uniref:Ubiquitin-associated/translation elongation factor EF1B, N-terminal, eukaryote n=1 Tax=Lasallia pustulata TaxID=136370 RepID=A0A1W5CUJ2_9LECA|nr:Ubiquitin-associated/translation elongation factor EF1B, N-terminal, eukaryote [Lasallia pustulata]